MPQNYTLATLSLLLYFSTLSLASLVDQQPLVLKYHNGQLLKGNFTVNLIWYGKFTPTQRSIIVDFLESLRSSSSQPSVSSWWKTIEKYKGGASTLIVGNQILNENYPYGKNLKNSHLLGLASKPNKNDVKSIEIILTAQDVVVDGFCMRCGSHGVYNDKTQYNPTEIKNEFDFDTIQYNLTEMRYKSQVVVGKRGVVKRAYIWVGNSVTQCPGQCAWPFYKPMYGPQTPPHVAPNGDVGVDGMIINLATLLAGTITNPFYDGYFQGPPTAPLEAVSACTGIFGTGAYPGYPGTALVDKVSGASYNANGVNGRKYLLPAMWDPIKLACSTLV